MSVPVSTIFRLFLRQMKAPTPCYSTALISTWMLSIHPHHSSPSDLLFFVFLLKLSVTFTSISLPLTSHTCNFKDQTLWEVSWPRNSAPYVESQYSFLCSVIISWARRIQISPSQYLRSILILSSIYNYIIQISSPHDSRLKLRCIFSPIAKDFGPFIFLILKWAIPVVCI